MARYVSKEEKELFLVYIAQGDSRATAAQRVNPEYTGTLFRRICNPASEFYDADFASSYVEIKDSLVAAAGAIVEKREETVGLPITTTSSGYTKAKYLTGEQLQSFLDLVRDGTREAEAARLIEPPTSITQIHRRANNDGTFARALQEARDEGYPAYQEKLRAEATRQAFAGDYRALRDQLLMHVPEARALTTNRHEVGGLDGGAIRLLAERHFSELPPEMLDEMIRTLEEKELGKTKEISAG